MRVDRTPDDNNEPWLTARDIIAEQGFNAELFIIRLISELSSEGNHEDAVLLFDVLHAIEVIRARKNITPPTSDSLGHFVVITWPLEQRVCRLHSRRIIKD